MGRKAYGQKEIFNLDRALYNLDTGGNSHDMDPCSSLLLVKHQMGTLETYQASSSLWSLVAGLSAAPPVLQFLLLYGSALSSWGLDLPSVRPSYTVEDRKARTDEAFFLPCTLWGSCG